MKHKWLFGVVALGVLLISGCASKEVSSSQAQKEIEGRYTPKVGSATKGDVIQEFGNARWCRPLAEGEECRFYRKKKTAWIGDEKKDKQSYETYDELFAEFDSSGILRSFKAGAQR